MRYAIFDVETNGLLYKEGDKPVATKIHCLSAAIYNNGRLVRNVTYIDYEEMRNFFWELTTVIGHNIKRFDIPICEKFLGMDLSYLTQIDTLGLSWYLYPDRHEHGLDSWGDTLGIEKPPVWDWQNDTVDTYIYRCQEDVKINSALYNVQTDYLNNLYENDQEASLRIQKYLSWKLDCAREQEEQRWRLDKELCRKNLADLIEKRAEKVKALSEIMPKVSKYVKKERPKNCYKKDETLSEHGKKWKELCESQGLTIDNLKPLKIKVGEEIGNPGSHQQVKDWLFSLGWKPVNIKIDKDKKTGEVKRIPQLSNQEGTDVDDGIKDLYDEHPELEALSGLYVIRHRIGILEGFLERVDEDGYLRAQIKGLTNTLRFQHTTIVNLPQIPKPYWEEVRGCLIADEGTELCGSDMSGLEDNTKHHYMYYFDPEYVKEMRTPGFDAHIDISVLAKAISHDEGEFYKWYDKKKEGKEYQYIAKATAKEAVQNSTTGFTFEELQCFEESEQSRIAGKVIKPIRLKHKKVNFAAVYGAGAPKLALTANISVSEAKILHTIYWQRNHAVKEVANACIIKKVGNFSWLFNPVSKFWYSLREEKDKFSTLNQGTGVYCFDTWVRYVRSHGIKLIGQFHDEIIFRLLLGWRDHYRNCLNESIQATNDELRLNVPLRISIDFGHRYSDIH